MSLRGFVKTEVIHRKENFLLFWIASICKTNLAMTMHFLSFAVGVPAGTRALARSNPIKIKFYFKI
ncbi:hypothetical protein [Brachyspira sp.]|uniref:hypothetical protein n=1 Tax=Brachyspira sp. TaxID=1977261 RepID=UPI003D7C7B97